MTSEMALPQKLLSEHPRVAEYLRGLWTETRGSPERQAILGRLASDSRMYNVYSTLLRTNQSSGGYLHAARHYYPAPPKEFEEQIRAIGALLSGLNVEDRQHKAVEETLYFTLCTAADKIRVTKYEEVEPARQNYRIRIAVLKEAATDMTQMAYNYLDKPAKAAGAFQMLADAGALLRAADWSEKRLLAIRGPDDPLTIKNDHGDPVARGVGGTIASFLNHRFGSPLYGTAAALASVALGAEVSLRVVRSAF
jgi:hypothetical protein